MTLSEQHLLAPPKPPITFVAPKRAPRQPRENIPECTKRVMELLLQFPGRRVTAGWIADRGLGFSEHAVELCLRALRKQKKVSRVHEQVGGLSYWTWPALPEPRKSGESSDSDSQAD